MIISLSNLACYTHCKWTRIGSKAPKLSNVHSHTASILTKMNSLQSYSTCRKAMHARCVNYRLLEFIFIFYRNIHSIRVNLRECMDWRITIHSVLLRTNAVLCHCQVVQCIKNRSVSVKIRRNKMKVQSPMLMLIELFKLFCTYKLTRTVSVCINEGVIKCELSCSETLLFNLWRDVVLSVHTCCSRTAS